MRPSGNYIAIFAFCSPMNKGRLSNSGHAESICCCKTQQRCTLTQESDCTATQNACPERVFSGNGSKLFLVLEETLQSRPGSKLITTRRFTNRWQHETTGVTQLLNGAWSSVPPCRNSTAERGRCLGRRDELHEGCPKTPHLPACSQQTNN